MLNVDDSTLNDLGIITRFEYQSLFNYFNYSETAGGKEWLKFFFLRPFSSLDEIYDRQLLLKCITMHISGLPDTITNGRIMVMDKFYYDPVGNIPDATNILSTIAYQIFNKNDYNILRYSVSHIANFVKGMNEIYDLFKDEKFSLEFSGNIERLYDILSKPFFVSLMKLAGQKKIKTKANLYFGHQLYKHVNKSDIKELEEIYFKFDAWRSMAKAMVKHNFHFPEIVESEMPLIEAQDLYHPLVENAVGYHFSLTEKNNFLFLTGANMAGKSTFIRAVGIAVYMASLGMGVPAAAMKMSCFDGLLSNIDVTDNTMQGESYFFNEVQRIKTTVSKISNGKKWLILIDELFKGTNIQDAMKCSTVVVEGLRKVKSSLFILSTHLYEIGEDLKKYPNIQFRYFETEAKDDNLVFNYRLKEGISNDRLGYLILRREKVVDMLNGL